MLTLTINDRNPRLPVKIDVMKVYNSYAKVTFKTTEQAINLHASVPDMVEILNELLAQLAATPQAKAEEPVSLDNPEDFFALPINHPVRRAFAVSADIPSMVRVLQSNPQTAQIVDDLPKWMKREAGLLPPKREKAPKPSLEAFSNQRKSTDLQGTLSRIPSTIPNVKNAEQMSLFGEAA